jgi:hypothetical protein
MVVYELPDVITNEPEQPHSKYVPGAKVLFTGVLSQKVQLIVALNPPVISISYSPQIQGVALGVGVGVDVFVGVGVKVFVGVGLAVILGVGVGLSGGGAGANVAVGVGVGVLVVVGVGVGVVGTQSPTTEKSAVPLIVPLQAQI